MKSLLTWLMFTIGLFSYAQINTAKIDSIVSKAVNHEFFEGTILIADKGETLYHKSFGFKDIQNKNAINTDTRFGIASITKMFTAVVIFQLIDEGKFKLTDRLSYVLPNYAISNAQTIQVQDLLLHISGLPNEDDGIYREARKNPEQFVNTALKNDMHPYGEFNYANIDYILLGLIIEKYDKRSWYSAVEKRLLSKAKMNHTGFLAQGKFPENFAYSFSFDAMNTRKSDPKLYIENYYAAGCMYATANDLLKFDQLLYNKELLSDESRQLLQTSYPKYNYSGYGVWNYRYPFANSQPLLMERRGGILGSNSVIVRMIESNKTLIILSNNNKFNPDSFGNINALKEALIIEISR